MKKISILCLAIISFLFSQSQVVYLRGTLQGSQETPPNTLTGSGVVIVQYNKTTKVLKLYGDYAGLSSEITESHIHHGERGVAGPITTPLVNTGGTTGTLTGDTILTQPQEDSLLAGNMYANVHTANNKAGELRAQLILATANKSTHLSGRLQGAQETPPNPSKGTGAVYALVDVDSVFVTGSYSGLTGASNNAHVHLANPGTPGDILFPVFHSAAAAGVVHAAVKVTLPQASTIATGGSYVNVHTVKYGGGEIRAQLINNTTVRYLAGELSGANVVPATGSNARGTVIASYDPTTSLLQVAGDFQNLQDSVTVAHIHLGAAGVEGPPIVPLNILRDTIIKGVGDSTGTFTVVTLLPPTNANDLLAGNMYVNVHSKKFPDGEIRVQLVPTTAGETQAFATNVTPLQTMPPSTTSAAIGTALVILDRTTGMTYVTSGYKRINSVVTNAYIRGGAVGDSSGSIFLPLKTAYIVNKKRGTASGSGVVSAAAIDSMISGLSYINIISAKLFHGAIRGQLGDFVLPVKLKYFNGYKQRDEVQLVWETAEELNMDHYEIEQFNTDTKNWDTKGTVYSKGSSNGSSYNFTDVPNVGSNKYLIYRLKMVDKDRKFTYSSLVKINFDKIKAELFIQTNPVVNGELKYTITGLSTGKKAEVSVIDYNGRLILRNTTSSLINNTLRIPKLASGMYKLMVRIDDNVLQQNFIK